MGFKVEKETEISCVIQASVTGEDDSEFLKSAQIALKNLWLNITIDFTPKPEAISAVMTSLFKLQQVIGSHNHRVSIKGVRGKVSSEMLNRLIQGGIKVLDEALGAPFVAPKVEGAPSTLPLRMVLETEGALPLPSATEMEARLKDLHGRFSQSFKRRQFLENEKKSYLERIKSLTQGRDDWHLNQDQIHRLSEFEGHLFERKNTRNLLQKDVETSQAEKLKEQDVLKKVIVEVKAEEKKRREVLDKKIAELNKKQEKIRADFKKKADGRKEKLARAGK